MLGARGVRVCLSGAPRGGGRRKGALPLVCGRWMGLVTRNWGERRQKLPCGWSSMLAWKNTNTICSSVIYRGSNLTSLCSQALIEKSGYTRLQLDRLPPCISRHNHHNYTNYLLHVLDLRRTVHQHKVIVAMCLGNGRQVTRQLLVTA